MGKSALGNAMLVPLADGLWESNAPLRKAGLDLGHRMTVLRLPGSDLLVHSPVEHAPALDRELGALGPVRHLVAPSLLHDLYLGPWCAAHPDAAFHASAGFAKRHPALPPPQILGSVAVPPEWGGTIETVPVEGMPRVNEVVLHHRPSRTLIVADLVFHLHGRGLSGLLLRLNGVQGRVGVSRLFRSFVRDKAAFRRSLERVLALDFDRLVMGHGDIVPTGAREVLGRAFDGLLR